MLISIVAGARPNFIKIAPIVHAIENAKMKGKEIYCRLIHTGQHYDAKMSDTFFVELNIPNPDVNLECGGGTQAEQTAAIMVAFEKELLANPSDLVIVVGDVTSTMACSIVTKKLNIKLAHVEAGIRSRDMRMPEEINRIVTDSLTDYFFTTTTLAGENLLTSGVKPERIFFVGNVMIDSLLANKHRFYPPVFWHELALLDQSYFVMTLHRPSNVDDGEILKALVQEIVHHAAGLPIIFPVHPRTAKKIKELGIIYSNLHAVEPLGYLQFNYLVQHAKAVITDSGGITEETTVLGVPCITLRENTERPETVEVGTNELIGTNPNSIGPIMAKLRSGNWKKGGIPLLWDGNTAKRIVDIMMNF